jgi:ubiquinone/menaquinone biosynthesis C-methylase UbiE
MSVREAYNSWADQYDTNQNKTRDLEAVALRETLGALPFSSCLEVGCGTGKNTAWLVEKAHHITAIDLSEGMLQKARQKIKNSKVQFVQADITKDWSFVQHSYDLITFSLVLEHIENLDAIFQKAAQVLSANGHIYVGELHPFKQYSGSKARFETETGTQVVECYTHHISDFVKAAKKQGLIITHLNEYFDEVNDSLPRILTLLFKKQQS